MATVKIPEVILKVLLSGMADAMASVFKQIAQDQNPLKNLDLREPIRIRIRLNSEE